MGVGARWTLAAEITIVLVWVGLLIQGRPTPSGPSPDVAGGMAALERADAEDAEWMGVYLEGQKIGTALSDRVKTPDGFEIQERSFLKMRTFDRVQEVNTALTAYTDPAGRLRSFVFFLSAPPVRSDVRGEVVDGATLSVDTRLGDAVSHLDIPLPDGPPDLAVTFKDKVLATGVGPGNLIALPYFDPASLSQKRLEIEILETGREVVDGEEVETVTLASRFSGFTSRATITRDGRTLREEGALGMTLRREPREVALHEGWGDGPPADLIALSLVPASRPIPDPRETRRLVARLSGGGVEALLAGLSGGASDDPARVTIVVPDLADLPVPMLPVVDPALAEHLIATPTLQKDEPEIARLARSVVGDDLRADLAARKLMDWVFKTVRKVPTLGVPSALEVLRTGQGDCNEHTVLYTALARAVGLPARINAGIVYSDEVRGGGGFFYHAWPEVWLGRWVAVDPTFGEMPADATHITLVIGDLDQQVALVRVIGKLDVDVLEVQ